MSAPLSESATTRPPSPPTPPSASSADADGESDGSQSDSVSRPSIYPAGAHAPAARAAPFEELYGAGPDGLRRLELLAELKTSRLEGLYNLSFLLLVFSLIHLAARNLLGSGIRFGVKNLCLYQIFRDGALCAGFGGVAAVVLPAISLALVSGQIRGLISRSAALVVHVFVEGAALVVGSLAITASPINPLFGGVLAVVLVAVVLKTHSYVITNALLAEETEKRKLARKMRRASSAQPRGESAGFRALGAAPSRGSGLRARPLDVASRQPHNPSASTDSLNSGNSHHLGMPPRSHSSAAPYIERHIAHLHDGRKDSDSLPYPKNVTLNNLVYFILAPTLVYETHYPRSQRVRWEYVFWHVGQVVICLIVQFIMLMQFCVPVLQESTGGGLGETVLLVMRLAIPVFIIFILTFWGFFHCILNVIAELLCFADRGFYKEWWNATTLSSFWRQWNVCVHEWCLRHVYVEANQRHHVRARTAAMGTFICSALLHEYVVATAFKVIPFSGAGYMFVAMCVQPPLMSLDRHLKGTRSGNLLMWTTVCSIFLCVLMFYAFRRLDVSVG